MLDKGKCLVRVKVSKTVQEEQYEPYNLEIETQQICDITVRDKVFDALANELDTKLYQLLGEHMEALEP